MLTKRGKGELLLIVSEVIYERVPTFVFYTCLTLVNASSPCTPHSSHALQTVTKFKRCHAMSMEHSVHLVRTSSVANSLQLVQLEMIKALVCTALTLTEGSTERDNRCKNYSYTA